MCVCVCVCVVCVCGRIGCDCVTLGFKNNGRSPLSNRQRRDEHSSSSTSWRYRSNNVTITHTHTLCISLGRESTYEASSNLSSSSNSFISSKRVSSMLDYLVAKSTSLYKGLLLEVESCHHQTATPHRLCNICLARKRASS